jgi:multisubunit Na+/H+ antiporter MnhG subunit
MQVVIWALLGLACAMAWISTLGVLFSSTVFERIHYGGPVGVLGSLFVATALLLEEGLSSAGVKAAVVAVMFIGTGPIITHAVGRSARIRQLGHWGPLPEEKRIGQ